MSLFKRNLKQSICENNKKESQEDLYIITAVEARRNSENCIPTQFRTLVDVIMKQIRETSNSNNKRYLCFDKKDVQSEKLIVYFEEMVNNPFFKRFFEKLGYRYEVKLEDNENFSEENTTKIIISW